MALYCSPDLFAHRFYVFFLSILYLCVADKVGHLSGQLCAHYKILID